VFVNTGLQDDDRCEEATRGQALIVVRVDLSATAHSLAPEHSDRDSHIPLYRCLRRQRVSLTLVIKGMLEMYMHDQSIIFISTCYCQFSPTLAVQVPMINYSHISENK
jgi:hypothetical protein